MKRKSKVKKNKFISFIDSNFLYFVGILIVLVLLTNIISLYNDKLKFSGITSLLEKEVERKPLILERNYIYLDRLEVNKEIKKLLFTHRETIYEFYAQYTNDVQIADWIINVALINNVPLHVMLAQCKVESGFYTKATNTSNKNGTIDYGLFQLNSRSYSQYTPYYLLQPNNNIRLAGEHLRMEFENWNSWIMAITAYNAGRPYRFPETTAHYLHAVLKYETDFNKQLAVFLAYNDLLKENR